MWEPFVQPVDGKIVNNSLFVWTLSLLLVIVNDAMNSGDTNAGKVWRHVPVKSHEEDVGPHLSNGPRSKNRCQCTFMKNNIFHTEEEISRPAEKLSL